MYWTAHQKHIDFEYTYTFFNKQHVNSGDMRFMIWGLFKLTTNPLCKQLERIIDLK